MEALPISHKNIPRVPNRPRERDSKRNRAAPGIVAPPPEMVQMSSELAIPPTIPLKKPKRLAGYPLEKQYPSTPSQPQQASPVCTTTDIQTSRPKSRSVSPIRKRRWFEWRAKSKEQLKPLKILIPQSQHRPCALPQLHQDRQFVVPFPKAAPGRTSKLPGGALQRQNGQLSQPEPKHHDRGSSALSIRQSEYLSRQFQLYSQQDMHCHILNPIVEGRTDNSSWPQSASFRRDIYISTWKHPPVRGNSAPPAKNYYPAPSIAPIWKICSQGRFGAGPEVTTRDEPRQPPLYRYSPELLFHQPQARKVSHHEKEGAVCSKATSSQLRTQNHSQPTCMCRATQDEEYRRSIPREGPTVAKVAHVSICGQPDNRSTALKAIETAVPEVQEQSPDPQAKIQSQANYGNINSTISKGINGSSTYSTISNSGYTTTTTSDKRFSPSHAASHPLTHHRSNTGIHPATKPRPHTHPNHTTPARPSKTPAILHTAPQNSKPATRAGVERQNRCNYSTAPRVKVPETRNSRKTHGSMVRTSGAVGPSSKVAHALPSSSCSSSPIHVPHPFPLFSSSSCSYSPPRPLRKQQGRNIPPRRVVDERALARRRASFTLYESSSSFSDKNGGLKAVAVEQPVSFQGIKGTGKSRQEGEEVCQRNGGAGSGQGRWGWGFRR